MKCLKLANVVLLALSSGVLCAEGWERWAGERQGDAGIALLQSVFREMPALSVANSRVVERTHPFLDGTYRIEIKDSENNPVIQFDWHGAGSPHLFNLHADNVALSTDLVMRLYLANEYWARSNISTATENRFRALVRSGLEENTLLCLYFRTQRGNKNVLWFQMPQGPQNPVFLPGKSDAVESRIGQLAEASSPLPFDNYFLAVGFLTNDNQSVISVFREAVVKAETSEATYLSVAPSTYPLFYLDASGDRPKLTLYTVVDVFRRDWLTEGEIRLALGFARQLLLRTFDSTVVANLSLYDGTELERVNLSLTCDELVRSIPRKLP